MSTKLSARRVRSTYQCIKAHRKQSSVHTMCRYWAWPQGYYAWLKQPTSNRPLNAQRYQRSICSTLHVIAPRPRSARLEDPNASSSGSLA